MQRRNHIAHIARIMKLIVAAAYNIIIAAMARRHRHWYWVNSSSVYTTTSAVTRYQRALTPSYQRNAMAALATRHQRHITQRSA